MRKPAAGSQLPEPLTCPGLSASAHSRQTGTGAEGACRWYTSPSFICSLQGLAPKGCSSQGPLQANLEATIMRAGVRCMASDWPHENPVQLPLWTSAWGRKPAVQSGQAAPGGPTPHLI